MRTSTMFLATIFVAGALVGSCADSHAPTAPAATVRARTSRAPDATTFTSLVVPGATQTFPLDINEHGVIVGRYLSGGRTHGFLRDEAGTFTTVDYPGSSFSVAGAVNDSGAIAGWYVFAAAPTIRHGFLLKDGAYTSFDPPGSVFTNPLGINERGDVTGRYCRVSPCLQPGFGSFHGFLMRDGKFTTIDVPGADETNAFKPEASGTIVGGFGDVGGEEQLFLYSGGAFTTFALPNGKSISQDNGGVNARGDIVGLYCNSAVPCLIAPTGTHAFLLSDGQLTTIDYPNAVATSATGINARGDVVGGYFDNAGVLRGFLLTAHGRGK